MKREAKEKAETAIRERFERLEASFNECTRRLLVASEAMALGHGGVSVVARATGVARATIFAHLQLAREVP